MIKQFTLVTGLMVGAIAPAFAQQAGGDAPEGCVETTAPNSFTQTFGKSMGGWLGGLMGHPEQELHFCIDANGKAVSLSPPQEEPSDTLAAAAEEVVPEGCTRLETYGWGSTPTVKTICRGQFQFSPIR